MEICGELVDAARASKQARQTRVITKALLRDPAPIDGEPWNADAGDWLTMDREQQAAFVAGNIAKDNVAIELSGIEPDDWVDMPFEARADVRRIHAIN